MAIQLKDKRVENILEPRHMLDLVDEYMGTDARYWIEDYLAEADGQTAEVADLEAWYEKRIDHYKEVIRELRSHSEALTGLICEKELNRKAISHEAGQICVITGRELR